MERRPLLGVSVLVVDDHEDTRELLRFILDAAGALATTVATARDAARSARILLPDAVVVDIALPGEDGYWLLHEMRQLSARKRIRSLALTAHARVADRERALAEGFDAYLSKPVDPDALVEALVALCVGQP